MDQVGSLLKEVSWAYCRNSKAGICCGAGPLLPVSAGVLLVLSHGKKNSYMLYMVPVYTSPMYWIAQLISYVLDWSTYIQCNGQVQLSPMCCTGPHIFCILDWSTFLLCIGVVYVARGNEQFAQSPVCTGVSYGWGAASWWGIIDIFLSWRWTGGHNSLLFTIVMYDGETVLWSGEVKRWR